MNYQENLQKKVETKLLSECKIEDTELSQILLMKRKDEIIKNHVENVCRIYEPTGTDGAKRYWMTKLTPHEKNKHFLYGKTEEELYTKIIAYYLKIDTDSKLTVIRVLELACESLSEGNAKRTKQFATSNLNPILKTNISTLTVEELEKSLLSLIQKTGGIKKKEFSGTLTALRKIQLYCKRNKIDCIDISECIKDFRETYLTGKRTFAPVTTNIKELVFNEKEVKAILEYAIEHPTFKNLAIALLLVTGLRVGELLALKTEEVYLDDEYIHICRMEDKNTGRIIEDCKDNSVRDVILNADAKKIVSLIFELREKIGTDSEWFILNEEANCGKMHLSAVDKYIRKLQKELEFSNKKIRSAHDCRRTYASIQYLKLGDKSLSVIQRQLGHKNISQTWEYIYNIVEPQTRMDMLKKGNILCTN